MDRPQRADDHRGCQACGVQFSRLNLVINLMLAVIKGFIGIVAASRALMASALYSVNDVLSAIIVMISLRVARRPADSDHHYGHGKAEFIAIGIVSTVLAAAVVFILIFSVADVIKGVDAPPHLIALLVAMVTMGTNLYLSQQGFCAARHLGSPVLHTSAEHNKADAISSLAAIIGVGGALLGLHLLDPVVAIFETLHIVWLSGSLLGNALRGLMDASLPPHTVASLRAACSGVEGVRGVVALRTRQVGPQPWVDVEIALDRKLDVSRGHRIAEQVRRAAGAQLRGTPQVNVRFSSQQALQPVAATAALKAGEHV